MREWNLANAGCKLPELSLSFVVLRLSLMRNYQSSNSLELDSMLKLWAETWLLGCSIGLGRGLSSLNFVLFQNF
jgi:hypothetical protein